VLQAQFGRVDIVASAAFGRARGASAAAGSDERYGSAQTVVAVAARRSAVRYVDSPAHDRVCAGEIGRLTPLRKAAPWRRGDAGRSRGLATGRGRPLPGSTPPRVMDRRAACPLRHCAWVRARAVRRGTVPLKWEGFDPGRACWRRGDAAGFARSQARCAAWKRSLARGKAALPPYTGRRAASVRRAVRLVDEDG
jgi:hypothetical protein